MIPPCRQWPLMLVLLTVVLLNQSVGGLSASAPPFPPISISSTSPTRTSMAEHWPLAEKAMRYFDASTDPFHAVQTSIDLLQAAGFVELDDDNDTTNDHTCTIQAGGKYYFTRHKSTLVAFVVGDQYNNNNGVGGGFKIIGGHTDSPNLRVKPRSLRKSAVGCIQLGVECYGGGLWHTWFDRDLGVSGRVWLRHSSSKNEGDGDTTTTTTSGDKIEQRLVKIDRAVLRISNLAIHLQTEEERKAFKYNKEDHLSPILALQVKKALTGPSSRNNEDEDDSRMQNEAKVVDGWSEHQEPALLQLLASELNADIKDIVDFELNLFDVQKASLGGAFSEFVYSARLDNLASCFLAVQALVDHVESGKMQVDTDVSMVVLYDHEEVGSVSSVGAASPILREAVRRIATVLANSGENSSSDSSLTSDQVYNRSVRRSFVLSSDQAHAVHPNYVAKHEQSHQPKMNQGMVIKRNSNQRYATTPLTGMLIREIARRAGLPPVQEFMVRQDCSCGSTIGPVISSATGIRAIDMGCPQLSMHSIRETMGICDLTNGLALLSAFFEHFRDVDSSVE